jgi:hypothetical protein
VSSAPDRHLATALLVATVALACRPGQPSADAGCGPSNGTLVAGAAAPGLTGRYRLILVATAGPRSGRRVEGGLRLDRDSTARSGSETLVAALAGATDIALDSVGALRAGDAGSMDPARPGVLVFASVPGAPPRILIRLGSEANRQDQQPFESAYTVLDVLAVNGEGFAGRWRSGVTDTQAQGYFCARRVPR